jgi:hypothetical protein
MSDAVLADLFPALNLAVIERQANHAFLFVTPPPAWLTAAFEAAAPGERNTLAGAFPFLDDFLHQADGAWNAGPQASIVSGPFAASVDGDELLLRATALSIGGRALLVLERLMGAADTRPMLQKARQHMLEGEQLARQATKVHVPAAALADAIARLLDTPLSADQRAIVDRMTTANDALASAIAGLPTPPARKRG